MSKRHKKKSSKGHSPLSHHRREGKELLPPFSRIKIWQFVSWVHERMPDQIWAGLLLTHLERDFALEILRTVAKACQGTFEKGKDIDLTLTGLAEMRPAVADVVLKIVTSAPGAPEALQPLLLFQDLPGRERWLRFLPQLDAPDPWSRLATTVAALMNHQSQESTDCRWARLLFKVAAGQMILQSREQVQWLRNYPYEGDQRAVRPFVRASEITESPHKDRGPRQAWADSFWQQCYERTECGTLLGPPLLTPSPATNRDLVRNAATALASHHAATSDTTAADPRHSAVFGLAAYALGLLEELLSLGNSSAIVGRLALRAIMESRITLDYLAQMKDPHLWKAYRTYGQGQAKLAFLKADEAAQPPTFVSSELLEQLANEEHSQEFVSIKLGHWADSDLRKMSEATGLKESVYDRFYPWTSAFMHASWAAVRATCFAVCGNPLHRLHLVHAGHLTLHDDVVADACELVDAMLSIVDAEYPSFPNRVATVAGSAGA